MDTMNALMICLLCLVVLLASGVWVGLALIGTAYISMSLLTTRPIGDAMFTAMWSSASSWSLTALPLFIWMGEILFRTRLSKDLFQGLSPWMEPLPGRLLHTNVLGSTIFAAVSGSSAATLTTVGKIAMPELMKRDYPPFMVFGTLVGSSTLGLMIPPSLIFIVYGVTVNTSISKLFMAGIFPGLLLASLFMGYIMIWSLINHQQIPAAKKQLSWREKFNHLNLLLPVLLLIGFVIAAIYSGLATATESAAIGVFGALCLAKSQGFLTREAFLQSILSATKTSCMIGLILTGAAFLTLAIGFTGLPSQAAAWINSFALSPIALIAALTVFYIILGMFLDGISAVVLTMAIVEPMIRQAGIDIVWFGVFLVIVVEMAQVTPPVGFNLFVMQGMTKKPMSYIAKTALPMFFIMLLMIGILVLFPQIATYLPQQMSK